MPDRHPRGPRGARLTSLVIYSNPLVFSLSYEDIPVLSFLVGEKTTGSGGTVAWNSNVGSARPLIECLMKRKDQWLGPFVVNSNYLKAH